jgi:tRNA (cmo5U34)-methyltransferase
MSDTQSIDELYAMPLDRIAAFTFNTQVADVFGDMIQRSVPGYATAIAVSGIVAAQYAQPDTFGFDLGCSLGATTLAMLKHVQTPGFRVIAVDNSRAMAERCRANLHTLPDGSPVDVVCADIRDVHIRHASVVVLNFTLQFVPAEQRLPLLTRIHAGLEPGGVLLLSEKVAFANAQEQQLFTELHHAFKKANGYSELEIAQKRSALENVLVAESVEQHRARLHSAGFGEVHLWFRCLNFASMLAVKR